VRKVAESPLDTQFGPFTVSVYEEPLTRQGHLALTLGDIADGDPVLVRVHSECVTGDALGSIQCACRDELTGALQTIQRNGRGVVLYMQPENRTGGLTRQILAYAGETPPPGGEGPHPSLRPDERDIGAGAAILSDLGVTQLRLLTNHPRPHPGLDGYGLSVVEHVPIPEPERLSPDPLRPHSAARGAS
jgi:3,4-dihydroxy 2-butanone 4-phosphate synthase/GTP cyclohydrolase II